MPPFLDEALTWSRLTAGHFLFMFWWIWAAALALTALAESFWTEGRRRRLLDRPEAGWRTVWLAVQLGVLSPPGRGRIFEEARGLLAGGVSPRGVVAYLVSAQTLLLWMPLTVVALNGPQLALGLFVAVAGLLPVLFVGVERMPSAWWDAPRERAGREGAGEGVVRSGGAGVRLAKSLGGQVGSLAWPLLFGVLGVGFVLALGHSPAAFSLQGGRGALVQAANGVAELLVAYVSGAPLVGNAFIGAGLWKAEIVTYAGLSAFYLGTLIMPFALPRYYALFGVALGRRLLRWLAIAILSGALAATAWLWGLDALLGALGLREWFEALTASTMRPSGVPWFHHWFAPGL